MIGKNLLILVLIVFVLLIGIFVLAGDITNDSAPAPTMYTLTDIYNLIHNVSTTTEANHSLFPSVPSTATSSYSVSQLYADLANLIKRENVATGTSYLNVTGDYGNPDPDYATTTVIASTLTPIGSAGDATGYSLEDIWNLITDGQIVEAGSHDSSPSAGPTTGSMDTLTQIYDALTALGISKSAEVKLGVTYLGQTGTYVPLDTTPPVVTDFSLPETALSLTIDISTFTATDDTAVTGYLLTETESTPTLDDPNWLAEASTTYTFASAGDKTLYAWAKDVAGNISVSVSDTITITLLDLPYIMYADSRLYISPDDNSTNAEWGCIGTAIGAEAQSDINGSQNTATIIASCSEDDIAAKLCSELNFGGYDDWYLPAKNQLNAMYEQKDSVIAGDYTFTGFVGSYWSSTERPDRAADYAWYVYFVLGYIDDHLKNTSHSVRCVRSDYVPI